MFQKMLNVIPIYPTHYLFYYFSIFFMTPAGEKLEVISELLPFTNLLEMNALLKKKKNKYRMGSKLLALRLSL